MRLPLRDPRRSSRDPFRPPVAARPQRPAAPPIEPLAERIERLTTRLWGPVAGAEYRPPEPGQVVDFSAT